MPLDDVQGQPRAMESLRGALRTGSIHHAWLFSGPEGVGKELAAVGFVQALLCDGAPNAGCGTCATCARVARRNHPDVTWVMPEDEQVRRGYAGRSDFTHTPSRDIKIEQVRKLQERLSYRALEGRYKVAVLALAEQLNNQAQNAFLKTLEEPPAGTIILLLASAVNRLLPTVRSRCSKVPFGPLPRELILQRLRTERKLDGPPAAFVAELSNGSLGQALAMDVEALAGRRELIESFEAVGLHDLGTLTRFAERYSASREEAEASVRLLKFWTRDVALARAGRGRLANADLAELASRVAGRISDADIHRRDRLLDEALGWMTRNNASPRLQWERLLIQVKRAERRAP
ncbi:MAG: DNA polymerase III subunit delta' [Deltaproteobacteria bacterium]|nr:DNA polymerase III subunit delta' [Deltaproteobacteria bacterium]